MAATVDFSAGGYRFIPGVFQYSGGVAASPGHEIQRVRFRAPAAAARRVCACRAPHQGSRPAAHLVLRLRAAVAGAVHRAGLSRLQRGLRRHAAEMGPVRRQGQSGRAQQCVPRGRSAGRALVPRVLIHRRQRRRRAELRDCRQRRGEGRRRELPRAHHPPRRNQRRRLAREGQLRARRDGAAAGGVRPVLGRHHGDAGLYRPRPASVPGRRDRAARRGPFRD